MRAISPAIHLNKHLGIAIAGAVCLLVLSLANGNSAANTPHWLQFSLLYAGIGLLIWGLGVGWSESKKLLELKNRLPRRELLILLGILTLALILRLWQLETKVRAPVDELLPMTEILALWDDPNLPMIRQFGFISSPTRLFASWQAGSVALFGHNLLALRIPSAIIGTLTVAAAYFLGRVLFDARTALIGALLLATYPPHIHFSRIGILNIVDPLFGTLALACIALALKTNWRMAWALGGVALGLSQYFYEGGRLLFPTLIAVWLILTLLRHGHQIREWKGGLFSFILTASLIAAPIYITRALLNDPLSARMNTLAISGDQWRLLLTAPPDSPLFDWWIRHTTDPFLLFINRPDPTSYYGGSTALLLFFLVPMFLLGLLWSIRTAGGRFLLLWFLAAWAGNLLMTDSALVARYLVVFPAVMLIIALGIVQTATYFLRGNRFKWALLYVGFCAIAQPIYYFGIHLETYNRQLVSGMDIYDAIYRAVDLPTETHVYIVHPPPTVTEDYAKTMMRFLSDDKTLTFIDNPAAVDLANLSSTSTNAFFIPADDHQTVSILEENLDFAAPQYTSDPVPDEQAYVLYLAVQKSE